MRSKLYPILGGTCLLAAFLLLACTRVVKNDDYYQTLAKYIYAFSNGSTGPNDPIRIRFVNAAVAAEQVGQTVDPKVLSIQPEVPGKAVWEDDRTIVLRPEKPMPFGQAYKGVVAIGRIYKEAPTQVRSFDFDFRVRDLNVTVEPDGVSAADLSNMKKQRVTGIIKSSDPVDGGLMEKILAAKQHLRQLNISWNHTEGNKKHYFTVNDVERANEASGVQLQWDATPLGAAEKNETTVPVPSLLDFGVVGTQVLEDDNQCIVINFSDPLQPNQDYNGLVTISDYKGSMTFSADGNFLRCYPSDRIVGQHNLVVSAGVRNAANGAMTEDYTETLSFTELKPAVRLVGRGAIIPAEGNGSVIFPFEAVGLNAVDVEIFKIYNSNILQFLQVNELEGSDQLERVGKIIAQKKIDLKGLNANASTKVWQRYALDLKELIKKDPLAIYQIRIVFRKSYTTHLDCTGAQASTNTNNDEGNEEGGEEGEEGEGGPNPGNAGPRAVSTREGRIIGDTDAYGNLKTLYSGYQGIYWDAPSDDDWGYYDDGFEYDHQSDPCHYEYYNQDHFVRRNAFCSDLGLTAKVGTDHSVLAAVTDLHTTEPVNDVEIEFYNYQLQVIGTTRTGKDGIAIPAPLRDKPFIMVAKQGNRRGYLRMADGATLSLSRFDVAGVEAQKGLKGYIYGERGVWRPGDSIYLNFVLEDFAGKLPANHPINVEISDMNGATRYSTVVNKAVGGVYPIHFATAHDAPTGTWMAKVEVGGAKFNQPIKVETVKPNRLKINLAFANKSLSAANVDNRAKLNVAWLHGAVAKNLKTKIEMQLNPAVTKFPKMEGYVFEDPARGYYGSEQVVFDGTLDDQGNADVPFAINAAENLPPGKLIASFKVRAFEQSGDFSVDQTAIDYFPYPKMVGVSIPADQYGNKSVKRGKMVPVSLVCVNNDGQPLANQTVEVGLYRCDWRWWWDRESGDYLGEFNSATHVNAITKATLRTDANGRVTWKVIPNSWGRYLVRASLGEGAHAAGDFFWSGYPSEANDNLYSRNAAAMLPLAADRASYATGDMVSIKVPGSEGGRALVTIENSRKVLKHLWFNTKKGDNELKFKADPEFVPAVYAHVTLLQPHAQTINDLPIRMYGIVPLQVEDPRTRLQPEIDMPEVLKPGEPFTVRLKEGGSKACTYTLAIVDEGLLDLTRFKTPNPHDQFFAREALGVKTWDVYDYVLGAYGVELDRILSVGGDAFNRKAKNAANVNRFKPAVIHVGPFTLEKGQTAKHTLKIENYVGSVRVMAVMSAPASDNKGAYGSSEKTCPVRKPLMILPTLPRVIGPGETVRLPIQVFAMEKKVKSATLRIRESENMVAVEGGPTQTLQFAEPGDQIAYFDIKVGNKTGPAHFTFEAQGGGETATDVIDIMVRNPMPMATQAWSSTVEAGKEWATNLDVSKFADIDKVQLEVSALPPMNIGQHMEYLIRYPHGCLEQTTSAAFPQLFADVLVPLSQKQKNEIAKNIEAAIHKIRDRQDFTGGFAYWPGSQPDQWSTTYAGHFLLEAKAKGYAVPEAVLNNWVKFQMGTARDWNYASSNERWYIHDSELGQAYRLFSLSVAGKPAIADMNRMRELKDLHAESAYLLASAYALAGKPEVAKELVSKGWRTDFKYDWCGYTYGSDLRDRALILEAYANMGDLPRAQAMLDYISSEMSTNDAFHWGWSTQSLATTLRAVSKYAAKANPSGAAFAYKTGNGVYKNGDSTKPISTVDLDFVSSSLTNLTLKNNSVAKLYARLVVHGQAKVGEESVAPPSNIAIEVKYIDAAGQPVNVAQLAQGTDFAAYVTVRRNSKMTHPFNEMALTQIFPSGWEITNTRMGNFTSSGSSRFDYQDFRDDRVLTYFDLVGGQSEIATYKIQLNASYKGRFYLPSTNVEGMYDNRIRASAPGQWVEVI
jgi:alpha-2-macroglobulin